MFRKLIRAALALCLSAPVALGADNEVICSQTAEIVRVAVAERAGGRDAGSIKRVLTEGERKVTERFVPTVGPLVDWVFTIEESELRAPGAAEAITGRYRAGCLSFKP